MSQIATRSIYRVVMGGTVLLAVDDLLWGDSQDLLKITPDFSGVEKLLPVGGGARTIEHTGAANRMHALEFTRVRIHSDVMEALKFQLMHPSEIPAGGQDVTIQITGYTGTRTLYKASVISAPIRTLQQLSMVTYTIVGGALTGNLNLTPTILDETSDPVTDETSDPMLQE